MTRPPGHPPIIRRLVIAAMAAVIGLLLLLVLEYRTQSLFHGTADRKPVVAAGAAPSPVSDDPPEISVFDEPRALPEIHFADDQGHDLTLADFRGRVVLLNIWATWCVPCRKEMSALDRLQAKLGGDDFIVLPLSIDREGGTAVERFYREVGVEKLGVYVDPSGRGSHTLAIPGVPTTLLIDRQGREVARKMGAAEWDGPEMVSLIQRTEEARRGDEENRVR
jgi:thiol-disulfide isomerase/thioredoxin